MLSVFFLYQGYDASNNTWEPEHHFASIKMLMDYHASVSKKIKEEMMGSKKLAAKENVMINEKNDAVQDEQKRDSPDDEPSVKCDFISEKDILKNRLIPEKVLNIFHTKGDEKSLIAQIQFRNRSEPAYVSSSWANKHCAQMVIKFYESRIYWQQQS